MNKSFYGWWLLLALCATYALIVGFTFYGAPILFPFMIEELEWGRTDISVGFMVSVLMSGFAAPLAAWCIDKYGSRKTLCAGALIGSIGAFMMQFVHTVPLYVLFFGVLVGAGNALGALIPIQNVIVYWFEKWRGRALGLVLTGAAIGGFIAPIVLTKTVQQFAGHWRTGWLAISLILFGAAVISFLFVRNKPSDINQFPDGIEPGRESVDSKTVAKPTRVFRASMEWSLKEVLKTREFWLLAVAIIGGYFIWNIIISQGPLHLADRGFTPEQYSLISGLTVGFGLVGRLGAGWLGDYVDSKVILIAAITSSILGGILFWFVNPDHAVTLAYPFFSGAGAGAVIVAKPTIISNYWGKEVFAKVIGAIFPVTLVFNSIAAPFAGAIYDSQGSYFSAMLVCYVLLGFALLAMLFVHPREHQAINKVGV